MDKFTDINQFLALLQGVEPAGTDQWKALCPAHHDSDPSLSITLKGSQILLKDFGGCNNTEVVKTLGLTMSHLWLDDGSKPVKERRRRGDGTPRQVVARYVYTDEQGKPLYRKLRLDPKSFEQERADGVSGWVSGRGCMTGVRRVLFDLPKLKAGIREGKTVIWVEGEKDACNGRDKLGDTVVVTTCVEGAGSLKEWNPEYSKALEGTKRLVLVPDQDKAGLAHMNFIARHLDGEGGEVYVLTLPCHDLSDWLADHSKEEFYADLLPQAVPYIPTEEPPAAQPAMPTSRKATVTDMIPPTRDTDLGNAERLVRLYGDRIRYCYERKTWYIWNGKVWETDMGAKINALAKSTVLNIYREAADEPDDGRRKVLVDHARRSESDTRIRAMLSRAESEEGIPISVTDMDADHWLLNCQNGIVDLKTGRLMRHDPAKLMTQITATEYDMDAPYPLWRSFIEWVTGGDEELATFIQRALGYSLTGDISEQILLFCYGLGGNGKTTLTSTFHALMGDYAGKLQADDLMVRDHKTGGGPTEGLANLFNKRYALGSEVRDGKRLDVGLIKDLTGGEVMNARHLYEREFKFKPACTLWLYGNKKPVIRDTSLAVWRRVKLVPFTRTVKDAERDRKLEEKMERDELPGILSWAILGCLDWQRLGLNDPEAVTSATRDYREEEDVLGEWLAECCYLDPMASTLKAELKGNYTAWCQENKHDELKRGTFKGSLEERGITSYRGNYSKHYWKGIRLLTNDDIAAMEEATAVAEAQKVSKVSTTPRPVTESPNVTEEGDVTNVTNVTDFPLSLHVKETIENLGVKRVTKVTKVSNVTSDSDFYCRNCRGEKYWLRHDGQKMCSVCHPPVG